MPGISLYTVPGYLHRYGRFQVNAVANIVIKIVALDIGLHLLTAQRSITHVNGIGGIAEYFIVNDLRVDGAVI